MFSRLRTILDTALESFWFIPLLMLAFSQLLTLPALVVGADPAAWAHAAGWEQTAHALDGIADRMDAEGARAILSTVASGMITTVSIVFSLSFVALTLTSQQLGPRIIDFWLQSSSTQILLGLCLSAFFASLNGLLAMTLVPTDTRAELTAVGISALLGALALIAVALFATRMSEAIRADVTVSRIGDRFVASAAPGEAVEDAEEARDAASFYAQAERVGRPLRAFGAGYLASLDLDGLAELAEANDMQIALTMRENDPILPGAVLALVLGGPPDLTEIAEAAWERMTLTSRRRRTGLADFEGDALVEVALRALSPSMNDPFTAMTCIDRIAEGCTKLAANGPPSRVRRSEDGTLRAAAPAAGADWLSPRLLHPVIDSAAGNAQVLERTVRATCEIRRAAVREVDRKAADVLLARIRRTAARLGDADDRALVERAMERGAP